MDRLTETGKVFTFPKTDPAENAYLERVQKRLSAYEDTGLEPGEINEARDEAYDLGYQSCLNYKGITWPEAAELQAYRALGTVEELSTLVKARDEAEVALGGGGDDS